MQMGSFFDISAILVFLIAELQIFETLTQPS